ncbi:MAG: ankyrin repeat domain-containing protein, partial [Planctomycetes bacterium]|nr:ankyrin repeat domain-containing protein [Planctomycetota bacterium]
MRLNTAVVFFALVAVTARAGLAQQETDRFFEAIRSGDTALVRQRVEADRELLCARDLRQWNGPTPVHAAMSPGREAVLDALLALGADPNAKNGKGEPAMLALRSQSPAKAQKLIDAGGDVDASDARGLTLLHYAVADRRSHELARFLIDNGANVNIRSCLGVTPSHVGASQGSAIFLNPAGARPEFSDWRGRSADYWARAADQLDSLQTPGRGQADKSGWTLLHEFAWQGKLECVTWCLEHQQLNHVNATDDEGTTPLHAAARFGFGRIADALLAAGADPTRRDLRGWTPIDIVAARGYSEISERLRQVASQGGEYDGGQPSRYGETTSVNATWVVKPGRLIADPPTLRCLGFRWWIEGDANRNATCRIEFRKAGTGTWCEFYPALRIGGETCGMGWTNSHMFAGSVIDLEPGTAYEIRLTLSDPDGNVEIQRRLQQATRSEPEPLRGGRQIHVGGQHSDFGTVQAAYDTAEPGDIVVVHQGVHHGDLVMNKAAMADKPIVIRGQPGAILWGVGNDLVNVDGARHHIFEDLTLTDADHAFVARGETHALTVRRCRFRRIKKCFFAISQRNRGFLIHDNDMDGPVQDWHPRRTEKSQGVWIAGQGHAVFHNRVRGFWDGLSIKGQATDDPELQNCAIDFYNNDLSEFLDDAIELDYGMHNLRVMRNRIRNTFMGISTQPVE